MVFGCLVASFFFLILCSEKRKRKKKNKRRLCVNADTDWGSRANVLDFFGSVRLRYKDVVVAVIVSFSLVTTNKKNWHPKKKNVTSALRHTPRGKKTRRKKLGG